MKDQDLEIDHPLDRAGNGKTAQPNMEEREDGKMDDDPFIHLYVKCLLSA